MRFEANRTLDFLELIHTDIWGPFPIVWNRQQYFMTFIDEFFRYGYICLPYKKSLSLDILKNFKAEVENQLSKRIKSKHDDSGEQRLGQFAKFLKEYSIIQQYSISVHPL